MSVVSAEDFLQNSLTISHFYDDKKEQMCCLSAEVQKAMEEFAKIRAIELLKKLRSDVIHYHYAQMTNIDLDNWIEKNV